MYIVVIQAIERVGEGPCGGRPGRCSCELLISRASNCCRKPECTSIEAAMLAAEVEVAEVVAYTLPSFSAKVAAPLGAVSD